MSPSLSNLPLAESSLSDLAHPERAASLHPAINLLEERPLKVSDYTLFIKDNDLTIGDWEPAHARSLESVLSSLLPPDVHALSPEATQDFFKLCFHVPEGTSFQQMRDIIRRYHLDTTEVGPNGMFSHGTLLSLLTDNDLRELRAQCFERIAEDPVLREQCLKLDRHTEANICRITELGGRFVLCTGSGQRVVTAALQAFDIYRHFDIDRSIFADTPGSGKGKPFPDPYLAVLQASGIQPHDLSRVLTFEDNFNGAMAAIRAGVTVILRPSGDYEETISKVSAALHTEGVTSFGEHRPRIDVVRCFSKVRISE